MKWVESEYLQPEMQDTNPAKFHDAWRALVAAQWDFFRSPEKLSLLIIISRGILVPGGFGPRGTEGMILAVKWAREQNVPFLGICLGFQVAVIEWARNICKLQGACFEISHEGLLARLTSKQFKPGANSTELDEKTRHPVVIYMPEISRTHLGGTMRLGLRATVFSQKWSILQKLYGGADKIWERHRHRYEVNPEYVAQLEKSGLTFVGKDESGVRMQVLEKKGNYRNIFSSQTSRLI